MIKLACYCIRFARSMKTPALLCSGLQYVICGKLAAFKVMVKRWIKWKYTAKSWIDNIVITMINSYYQFSSNSHEDVWNWFGEQQITSILVVAENMHWTIKLVDMGSSYFRTYNKTGRLSNRDSKKRLNMMKTPSFPLLSQPANAKQCWLWSTRGSIS